MTNIHLVKDERSRLLQPLSLPRAVLAGLIDRRLGIANNRDLLMAAAAKLQKAQHSAGDAAAALSALDGQEVAAMTAWASSPSGPAPIGDASRREELQRAVRIATAQDVAAAKAEAGLAPGIQRENAALQQIEPHISLAIANIVIEEVEGLLTEFEAASKSLHAAAGRIMNGKETVLRIAENGGGFETMQPAFQALEKLSARMQVAFQTPAPSGDGSEWPAFAGRLRSDPITRLED
jgi:hypothetical protein